MSNKNVYFFGKGEADGKTELKNLLGGKGANLAEMTNLGVPVPPGFTISTEVCTYYVENGEYPTGTNKEIEENLKKVEDLMGQKFGSTKNPLLLSVRSGARVSMPGMMDTVLNLGLNDETVEGLVKQTDNPRFAYDSYRRFVQMFGNVVLGIDHALFEAGIESKKEEVGAEHDTELNVEDLKELVEEFKDICRKETGDQFPEEPEKQLEMSIEAVFESWDNPRAINYRNIHDIPHNWGTAVNVQTMVYGNMGEDSGTGVAFTRDPATGAKEYYGEYLRNAQGEDVVAGIRTPKPISELEQDMPEVYEELTGIFDNLENHYRDMQDLEFTIQQGTLYVLQTRTGKRTAKAAVTIAVDMVDEGLIDEEEAIMRVEPDQLEQLLHPRIDPDAEVDVIAKGLGASPGVATGEVVFTADEAHEKGQDGQDVILVRTETSPEDVHGMAAAQGILTARGGMTSHAAIVARGMGKCCVAGCEAITVDYDKGIFVVDDNIVNEGDIITIEGTTGNVMLGDVPTLEPELDEKFNRLMKWADEIRTLGVRTNADTPEDADIALDFGAEGIGLCRTEHMFFGEDRLPIVQDMILSESTEQRQASLDKLLPMQKSDFKSILKTMSGKAVTIRLLDPPLHEFLPDQDELLVEITRMQEQGADSEKIEEKQNLLDKIEALAEMNPMLGHRGCRLGVSYPEIYEMQARAILEASCELSSEGVEVIPEIMIPLIGDVKELKMLKDVCIKAGEEVMEETGVELDYLIGTMIELPRACLTADDVAEEAEFFSFGTNDLTQTTFGFSRDDAEGKFLHTYLENNLLEKNPFAVLDQQGVGELVRIGVERGRKTNKDLKIGICGEHGGETASVKFCHVAGLDYVSCSPFRIPIARLAAGQAEIENS